MTTLAHPDVEILVARQPIFDRSLGVVAYELLYRASADATSAGIADPMMMTNTTLANGVLGIGLDDLVGPAHAWVNLPQDALESDLWTVLDPARCVIELLETVQPTPAARAAIARLHDAGFRIALDDLEIDGPTMALLPHADYVKFQMKEDRQALAAAVHAVRGHHHRPALVAECIETANDFEWAFEHGFEFYQGWHFGRAETVVRRDIPPQITAVAAVMRRIKEPDSTDRDIELGFQADPSLMLKLLRIANSAAFGLRGVHSAKQALQIVGRDALWRWLAILMVASVPRHNGVDEERLRATLERARLCELVGEYRRGHLDASTCFLAGLLSKLDVLLGVPVADVLEKVQVTDDVRDALLHGVGPMAPVLRLADAVEHARFDLARELADTLGVGPRLREFAAEAMKWTHAMRSSVA